MIAALFVEAKGVYSGISDVDLWDLERDARAYQGPYPVVAHPPCQRWGNYATGGPTAKRRFEVGDDAGCFASALASVRRWGGVLEHPENSKAWARYGLLPPLFSGGWSVADWVGGWTCCVDQGHYAHRAQKSTWLYAVGCKLPSLRWGRARGKAWIGSGFNKPGQYQEAKKNKALPLENLSKRERIATPLPFRDLLLSMARSVCMN